MLMHAMPGWRLSHGYDLDAVENQVVTAEFPIPGAGIAAELIPTLFEPFEALRRLACKRCRLRSGKSDCRGARR